MARKLKVYGWTGMRRELTTHHKQSREIVATTSKVKAGEIAGEKPWHMFNLGETGNPQEIEVAMAEPGVIFWRGLDEHRGEWRRDG